MTPKLPLFSPTVTIALIVSMGGFLFGFDASVISGVIGYVGEEYRLGDWEIGLMVSAPTLGGIIAGSTVGPLSDRFGRRRLLLIIAILYSVSAIASALAPSITWLVVARFIGGLGFASLGLAPIYIAEISPAHQRGRMISINQLNIVLGFSAAYFCNYFFQQVAQSEAEWVSQLGIDRHTWRWMLGLEIIPALIYVTLLTRVPESPRWLLTQKRCDEAKQVLNQLSNGTSVQTQLQEIENSSARETAPLLERLRRVLKPSMRMVLILGLFLAMIQQITGINAIYFYAPSIFEQSGIGTDAAFAQAVWVGIINVIFTLIAMALIDRIGRKPLLLIGLSGIALSMLLCAYGFHSASYQLDAAALAALDPHLQTALAPLQDQHFANDVDYKQALAAQLGATEARLRHSELIAAAINMNATIVLVAILGFVASFAVSLGPVMWVMLPEIFPNQLRGVAMAITGFANSAASFGIQFFFPWQLTNMGAAWTFLNYGVFALLGFMVVLWFLPETRNKSLEQLERELADNAVEENIPQAVDARTTL
jgi:sugar porter (SP) family MFS transporter